MMSKSPVKSPDYNEIAIPSDCAGLRLDAALARLFPAHSRSRLQGWLKEGLIQLDGNHREAKHKVWGGEHLSVAVPSAPTFADAAQEIPLSIVFEDAALLVIDKPVGMVVHPGNGNPDGTLMNALLHHAPELAGVPRAGIVHRLDKDTSGLLVIARTLSAQTDLVRQLQARTVKRRYLALVHGKVGAGGTVNAPLDRHPVQRVKMAIVRHGGKEAITHFDVKAHFADCTLLECRLETGRTHQIRVHMTSIGHPLAGDPVYGKTTCGNPVLAAFPRQALHAWQLALVHPESAQPVQWESPLPEDFTQLLASLRGA
jgi:23S rRNA pseudouridine1911/1915/1917 synthase